VSDRADAPSGVTVEPGDADDAEAVADCWVDLAAEQRDHGSHLFADRNRSAARETALRHAVTGGLFVARPGDDAPASLSEAAVGGLLGFVTASPTSGSFATDADRGVVRNIYVRPAARGEGIGTALLVAAEDHLVENGASVLSLEVMARNEAARRFYRRHGYDDHRVEMEKPVADR
jgi:ribosomal protein S18 acetylase RimI-like enzyme